jgi:hypothetical protein
MTKNSQRSAAPQGKRVSVRIKLETASAFGGAAVGAAAGMIGGPPGAVTGAIAGAIVGAVAAAVVDRDRVATDLEAEAETDARSHSVTPGRRVPGQRGVFSGASLGTSTSEASQPAEGPIPVPDE